MIVSSAIKQQQGRVVFSSHMVTSPPVGKGKAGLGNLFCSIRSIA
jgi:hypothetical protein